MRHKVRMYSDEFGAEFFLYDSMVEALEGMQRLQVSAVEYFEEDGIVRDIAYLGEEDEEEDA